MYTRYNPNYREESFISALEGHLAFCIKDEALTAADNSKTQKDFSKAGIVQLIFCRKNTLMLEGNFNSGNQAGLSSSFSCSDQTMTGIDLCLPGGI